MPMNQAALFGSLPAALREDLIKRYNEIARNFAERRWEPAELNGGKLSEVVYTIIAGALAGNYPASATKPTNMVGACRALEQQPASTHPADRSLRILLPRAITTLYEIRNNRGVGHVGGDVDSNEMDAMIVFTTGSWIMAELVRIFHGVSTAEAQTAVQALIERKLPLVWQAGEIRRVLVPKMNVVDQAMLLMYSVNGWVPVADLLKWTEYQNPSRFRKSTLEAMHQARAIEFDREADRACLTPVGIARVEQDLLPK
jgi:hypothetical protein